MILGPGIKISIITVCFNSATTIGDTLRSVAGQTHPDIEHIIVDGQSTDGTMDVVNSHRDKLARVVSAPDNGIYDAMNKGIALATGDILGFLNSDDILASNGEMEFVAKVFDDAQVDACYADLVYVDENDPARVVRYWKSIEYQHGLFRRGWMPAHPTFYARRSAYERLGGFDLRFPLQADFDLTMRFLEVHHLKSRYIPRVLVKMRMGGASNNSLLNILKGNMEAYQACLKNGLSVTPFFIVRKIASRIPQFFTKPPR